MLIEQISVVILAKNEEAGLGATLARLADFRDIVVVDSKSTDNTAVIAEQAGARVVQFEWDGKYPKKKQWSLEHAGVVNDWVLLLDADEFPSASLVSELRAIAPTLSSSGHGAYDINLLYRFGGRYLRYGHVVTKRSLLNVSRASFPEVNDLSAPGIREVEGHYQPITEYPIGKLKYRIVHDDRDPVSSWFDRHNRYSDWESYLATQSELRRDIARRRTLKGQLFDRLPLKPLLFFAYAYLARGGFLDGRAGFDYALALSTYYWQIGVKYRERVRLDEVDELSSRATAE
jgi:glycosyltransferase involved in cell wall biosynthesis